MSCVCVAGAAAPEGVSLTRVLEEWPRMLSVQGTAPPRSEPMRSGFRALVEASRQLGSQQCRLSCQAVAPRMVLSLEPCTEASCWCHVGVPTVTSDHGEVQLHAR